MKRKLSNWLTSYLEYVEETESADIYKTWVGISTISSALRRKTGFSLGRIAVYPNLYVVLVGPPGARKTQAIKFGNSLLKTQEDIVISADAITREALLQDLEQAIADYPLNDAKVLRHCSMLATCSELETFLGNKKDNAKMLITLTDLWDCPDLWRYRTKGAGTNVLSNIYLSIIAATTPESIANSIPATASGTGFISRIIFCYADKKAKKVPIPRETKDLISLRKKLIFDLAIICKNSGVYKFSNEGEAYWIKWYTRYDDADPDRFCQDTAFNGWYERKPIFILKLAMIYAAATTNVLLIEPQHIDEAIRLVESTEPSMGRSFRAVGRSDLAAETDMLMNLIAKHRTITEKKLYSIVWRDLDDIKFQNVIATIVKTGQVTRKYSGSNIIYQWTQ